MLRIKTNKIILGGAISAEAYEGIFGQELIGTIQIRCHQHKVYRIQQFMVKEEQRNKRIGRRLFEAGVKKIKKAGGTTIIVYPCPESYPDEDGVAIEIEELYAIYKKLGFAFADENADISKCNQKMYMTIS